MKKTTFKIQDVLLFGANKSTESIALIDSANINYKAGNVEVKIRIFPDEETMGKEEKKNFNPSSVNFISRTVIAPAKDYPKGIDGSDALKIAKSLFQKTSK